ERMPEENRAESFAAMVGEDTDVLDCADFVFGNALQGAARERTAGLGGPMFKQPRRGRDEAAAARDVVHQAVAAFTGAERGKDIGVHFPAEAFVFGVGVRFEQPIVPRRKTVFGRQVGLLEEGLSEVNFHTKAAEIDDAHGGQEWARGRVREWATGVFFNLRGEMGVGKFWGWLAGTSDTRNSHVA